MMPLFYPFLLLKAKHFFNNKTDGSYEIGNSFLFLKDVSWRAVFDDKK